MFGSVILDVAIGMIFVFLLLSLMVTTANEIIASALMSRAKWLRKGLNRLLTAAWVDRLYAHPLIQGTAVKAPTKWQGLTSLPWRGEGPSYIPSRTFATALLDLVSQDTGLLAAKTVLQRTLDQSPTHGSIVTLIDEMQDAISALPSNTVVGKQVQEDWQVLLAHIRCDPVGADSPAEAFTISVARGEAQRFIDKLADRYMKDAIAAIPDQHVSVALSVLLDDAGHNLERFKENIEVWFNNSMDRVGGWYKRRSQWVIGALAITVAVMLNVDTLLVLHHLSTQTGARDALVAQARGYAEHPPTTTGASGSTDPKAQFTLIQDQLDQLDLPIGWFRKNGEKNTPSDGDQSARDIFRERHFLMLPKTSIFSFDVDFAAWWRAISFHLVGWLLTALAASMGAPFWFDTLNKFMSVRAAGKAPEEKPKPPKDVPTPLEPGQTPREADSLRSANSK